MTNTAHPVTPKNGMRRSNALSSGCLLDEYRIDAILGAGGFGVTYKAWDTLLETWVAIKEYFPVEWSFRDADGVTVRANTQGGDGGDGDGRTPDYLWGLERFLDEARVLARVQHPFVVRVKRYFRAHGTAYIVMDYEDGEPLNAVLQDGETLDEGEVRGLLEDVLPALQAVHEQGFLHRDIKPSNLYLRACDHRVILIDFGAAREAVGRHSKSVTSLVTPGYSPPEQYTTRNDRYGTWTDVYALGAVLYRCVTGRPPTEAAERLLEDSLEPAVRAGAGRYSASLLRVIDRALAVRPERRFATVAEMRDALGEPQHETDNSDETVIVVPLLKPGGRPGRGPEVSHPVRPSVTLPEPVKDGASLKILPPLDASQRLIGQRPEVSRPPPKSGANRRKSSFLALIGGGLVLAVLAFVWLSPFSPAPEEKPPPRYSLGQRQQPNAMPDESPPIIAEPPVSAVTLPPVPVPVPVPVPDAVASGSTEPHVSSVTPPAVPVADATVSGSAFEPAPVVIEPIASPPAAPALPLKSPDESPAAETGIAGSPPATPPNLPVQPAGPAGVGSEPVLEATDLPARPMPVEAPASERSQESVTEKSGEFLTPSFAPAVKPQNGSTAKSTPQRATANKTGVRPADASTIRSRTVRRQAGRRPTEPRSSDLEPKLPVREKPARRTTVSSPWELPASSGFNQK